MCCAVRREPWLLGLCSHLFAASARPVFGTMSSAFVVVVARYLCGQAQFKPIAQNFLLIISSRRIEAISVTSFFEFAHDWLTQFPKLKRQIRGKSCPPFLSVQFNFGEVE